MYKDYSCICISLIYSVYNFLPSNYFISMYEISLTINRVLFWPVWSLNIFFFSSWGTPRENLLHVFKLETFFYSHNIDLYSVSLYQTMYATLLWISIQIYHWYHISIREYKIGTSFMPQLWEIYMDRLNSFHIALCMDF